MTGSHEVRGSIPLSSIPAFSSYFTPIEDPVGYL